MNNQKGVIHFKNWSNSFIPEILKELYIDRIYHPYLRAKFDMTILDLGCNIGLFSLYASAFAKQIYAFEPSQESFDLASQNIKDNNLTNIKLFKKAISKDNGTAKFWHADNITMNSMMEIVTIKNNSEKTSEEVEKIRLDDFVKEEKIEHIHFMKMDIEGSEGEVIGSQSFENITPILDSFVLEYHDWAGISVQQLVTTIRDYGYRVELIPSQAVILGATKI